MEGAAGDYSPPAIPDPPPIDYALLALDGEAPIVALDSGRLEFFVDAGAGLSARLTAIDGTTFIYGKLGRQAGDSRWVRKGETIAFQPPPETPKAVYGVLPMPRAEPPPAVLTPEQLAANRKQFGEIALVIGGVASAVIIVVVARDVWKDRASKKRRRT